jgi:hypothetical protein
MHSAGMHKQLVITSAIVAITAGAAGLSGLADGGPTPSTASVGTSVPSSAETSTAGTSSLGTAGDATRSGDPAPGSASDPWTQRSIEIDCGGFDATGNLVNPQAARIERAPLGEHGQPEIPDICGGYTVEGTFIGDD